MATVAWVVLKHHKKTDGTFNPKIRINHNRSTAYIPTGIYTPLVRFKRGSSTGTITDGSILDSLNDKVSSIRKIINLNEEVVEQCDNAKTLVEYIERYISRQNIEIDFIAFSREYIALMPKPGTRIAHSTGINILSHYLVETTGKSYLPIKKLTSRFLLKYESWLRSDRVATVKGKSRKLPAMKDAGINHYMVSIQVVFNQAKKVYNDYELDDIIIKGDPFKAYKIPEIKRTAKRAITKEDILKIYNYVPPKDWRTDALARDLFLFSFMMAGMNAVDIYNCVVYKDGRIEYCRKKTTDRKRSGNAFISVPVVPEIMPILEKYRDKIGSRVFGFYHQYTTNFDLNVALHRGLKMIEEATGIPNLQFYCARHSFATIARNDCGVSMDDIAFCLTHSSGHDITDTYIKPDFSRVDEVIRKVVNYVFGEEEKRL